MPEAVRYHSESRARTWKRTETKVTGAKRKGKEQKTFYTALSSSLDVINLLPLQGDISYAIGTHGVALGYDVAGLSVRLMDGPPENVTRFSRKRHEVFQKTSRGFSENVTRFSRKRHEVFLKTSRGFSENVTRFF